MPSPIEVARDPIIGITVDSFVVKSKLAEGGMGAVYLAVHERLPNKKKVLKVLLAEFSNNPAIRARFEREALTASRIEHPHIVKIDSFGTLPDGQLYLLMPFLEGKSLDTHLSQNGRLTLHHTCHIMLQVWSALECLHEAGIVHRDLKPGNVFIQETRDNAYHITVIDLGIVKDAAQEASEQAAKLVTQAGSAIGTPGYMAVEQYDDAAKVTASADVYASAVVTWELLTGQRPWGFHQPGVLHHLQMTISPEPAPGHGHPSEVFDILRKALDPHVEERFESARALAVAFSSVVPAIPPHVPSGARMMSRLAPDLLTNASPDIMTVRDRVGSDPEIPSSWPYRGTRVTPLVAPRPSDPVNAARAVPTPAIVYTANELPPTVSQRPSPIVRGGASAPSLRWRRLLLAIAAGGAIGVGAFFVVRARSLHQARVQADATIASPANMSTATVKHDVEDAKPEPQPRAAPSVVVDAGSLPVETIPPAPISKQPKHETGLHHPPVRPPKEKLTVAPAAGNAVGSAAVGSSAPFDIDAVEK